MNIEGVEDQLLAAMEDRDEAIQGAYYWKTRALHSESDLARRADEIDRLHDRINDMAFKISVLEELLNK